MENEELREINPIQISTAATSNQVAFGLTVPKQARLSYFDPNDWEEFVQEWAQSLKSQYTRVAKTGGAGDMGVDVMCFCSDQGLKGEWHNYQCKHYAKPLAPTDIWAEIAKSIYYSFMGEFSAPAKYYFVAPKGIGTKLTNLLLDPERLKAEAKRNWPDYCELKITSTINVPLESDLLDYFEQFDFSIFDFKSTVELVDQHSTTIHHAVRFGGGLPARPANEPVPNLPLANESHYIRKILDAYGDADQVNYRSVSDLNGKPNLDKDFRRQRERFYNAESLRNFARDTVPYGTFSELQNELFNGVIDVAEGVHVNGHERMRATMASAASTNITANALATVTKIQDRQGICHQLANDDKLNWVADDE
jgi:hypothetical protein